jgi:DNA polymerase V
MTDHRYAKVGVLLNDFSPNGVSQLNLSDEVQPRAHSGELMRYSTVLTIQAKGRSGSQIAALPRNDR